MGDWCTLSRFSTSQTSHTKCHTFFACVQAPMSAIFRHIKDANKGNAVVAKLGKAGRIWKTKKVKRSFSDKKMGFWTPICRVLNTFVGFWTLHCGNLNCHFPLCSSLGMVPFPVVFYCSFSFLVASFFHTTTDGSCHMTLYYVRHIDAVVAKLWNGERKRRCK